MDRSVLGCCVSGLRGMSAVLCGLALVGSSAAQSGSKPPTPKQPGAELVQPPMPQIRVIPLNGTARQRGVQHGKALRKEIQELVAEFKKGLTENFKMPADEFLTRFRLETSFEAAALKWTPKLVDEVRGIAEGAEVDYDTMFCYQLVDEIWAMGGVVLRADKCSSIGVNRREGQCTVVAQNMDLPKLYHGHHVLLQIQDGKALKTRMQSMVVTVPGLIGLNGLNELRIGVAVNTLLQLTPRPDGLPVAFVVRGLLSKRSFADARKFLFDVPHASGQNYILGGPDVAHSYEASAHRLVRFVPKGNPDHVWHTNHPLANREWSPAFLERAKQEKVAPEKSLRPCTRLDSLKQSLPLEAAADIAGVTAALRAKGAGVPVCNPSTWGCTIMLLSGTPTLRFSPGAPDQAPLLEYRMPGWPEPKPKAGKPK